MCLRGSGCSHEQVDEQCSKSLYDLPPAAPREWGGVKPLRGRSLPGAKLLKKFDQNFCLGRIKSAHPLPAAKQLIASPCVRGLESKALTRCLPRSG